MSTKTLISFTPADVAAAMQAVDASLGKGGAMAICKTYARGGLQALKAFEAATAFVLCERHDLKPGMSLASIDALKRDARFITDANPKGINPASTVYNYCLKLRPIAGKLAEIDALTASAAMGNDARAAAKAKREEEKAKAAKAEKAQSRPLTVADCLTFLGQAKAAGMLTAAEYAAIEDLLPQRRTVDMGMVIPAAPALPQPAAH